VIEIELCPIVPLPHLELAKDSKKDLLLAGLLDRSEYVNFYKQKIKGGSYAILDCGSFETAEIDDYSYLTSAEDLGVQELMVPDVVGDSLKTMNRAKNFLEHVTTSRLEPFKLEIVPQGSNIDEYLTCLTLLMKLTLKHKQLRDVVIGISKVSGDIAARSITKTNRCYINRPIIVNLVEKLFPQTEIHLLGLVDPVELFAYRYHEKITGIDTTAPFNHALLGCSYKKDYIFDAYPCSEKLPRVDLLSKVPEDTLKLAEQNLNILNRICHQVSCIQ